MNKKVIFSGLGIAVGFGGIALAFTPSLEQWSWAIIVLAAVACCFLFNYPIPPDPMTDDQLRDWALRIHAKSVGPAKLPTMGIETSVLLAAQSDDHALGEVRRWSGIPKAGHKV